MSSPFDYQIHLILEAKHCFLDLKFLGCSIGTNQNILEGVSRIIKSIRKLEFCPNFNDENNSGIVKLIESQKNLNDICFTSCLDTNDKSLPFYKTLENY